VRILRGAIPQRYRLAVSLLSFSALRQRHAICSVVELTAMTNDKLKSTTVRFTDSDLRLIDRLRDKLGLGMIQVIRLAIRRLAEIENISSPPTRREC